jgi:hypothetical protein
MDPCRWATAREKLARATNRRSSGKMLSTESMTAEPPPGPIEPFGGRRKSPQLHCGLKDLPGIRRRAHNSRIHRINRCTGRKKSDYSPRLSGSTLWPAPETPELAATRANLNTPVSLKPNRPTIALLLPLGPASFGQQPGNAPYLDPNLSPDQRASIPHDASRREYS